MFQEADIDLAGFQQLDAQVTADQDFRPARQKVLTALSSLLDQAEVHRMKSIGRIPSTVRVPGCLSEVDEGLLPFVRDPIAVFLASPQSRERHLFQKRKRRPAVGSKLLRAR